MVTVGGGMLSVVRAGAGFGCYVKPLSVNSDGWLQQPRELRKLALAGLPNVHLGSRRELQGCHPGIGRESSMNDPIDPGAEQGRDRADDSRRHRGLGAAAVHYSIPKSLKPQERLFKIDLHATKRRRFVGEGSEPENRGDVALI